MQKENDQLSKEELLAYFRTKRGIKKVNRPSTTTTNRNKQFINKTIDDKGIAILGQLTKTSSFENFDTNKIVSSNIKDYIHAKDHKQGCTGCVDCMKLKQQHTAIQYKYPVTTGTIYKEQYKKSKSNYIKVNSLL